LKKREVNRGRARAEGKGKCGSISKLSSTPFTKIQGEPLERVKKAEKKEKKHERNSKGREKERARDV